MEIVLNYSDKSFVVNGDTKPFKTELMSLGGRYNPSLRGGPGFVFPNKKENEVKEFIGNNSESKEILSSDKQLVKSNSSKKIPFTQRLKVPVPKISLPSTPVQLNYPNRFVGGDGLNYQIIIQTSPLPLLDQKVILKTVDDSYNYIVSKINEGSIVNDIMIKHETSEAISRAVIINGEWQIFGMFDAHELIF